MPTTSRTRGASANASGPVPVPTSSTRSSPVGLNELGDARLERGKPPQRRLGDAVGVRREARADGVVVHESTTRRLARAGLVSIPVASS